MKVFSEGRGLDVEQLKKMTKIHDKELLRDLHGVRAVKAHHSAQSVFASFPPFYISAQAASFPVFRGPSPTKLQI